MHVHVHETIVPYFSFDFDELDELFEALEAATFQISLSMDCLSVTTHRVTRGTWGHSKQVVAGLMSEGVVVRWVQQPTSQQ